MRSQVECFLSHQPATLYKETVMMKFVKEKPKYISGERKRQNRKMVKNKKQKKLLCVASEQRVGAKIFSALLVNSQFIDQFISKYTTECL